MIFKLIDSTVGIALEAKALFAVGNSPVQSAVFVKSVAALSAVAEDKLIA